MKLLLFEMKIDKNDRDCIPREAYYLEPVLKNIGYELIHVNRTTLESHLKDNPGIKVLAMEIHSGKCNIDVIATLKPKYDFKFIIFQCGMVYERSFPFVSKYVDTLVTVTRSDAIRNMQRFPKLRIRDIIFISNYSEFYTFNENRKDTLLFTGRIHEKRITLPFLETIRAVPGTEIDLYGNFFKQYWSETDVPDNAEIKRLKEYFKGYKDIFHVNPPVPLSEMNDLFNQYKVVLYPANDKYDTFNISLIEAINAGCIPITLDIDTYDYVGTLLPRFSSYYGMVDFAKYLLKNGDMYLFLRDSLQAHIASAYNDTYFEEKWKEALDF